MAKKIRRIIGGIIALVIVAGACFVLSVQISFRRRYEVSVCNQYSMVPNINLSLYLNEYVYKTEDDADSQPGDYALVDKKAKNFKVGDIVSAHVSWPETKENEAVVKRLVGMPNDKIRIDREVLDGGRINYHLYVNNKLLYTKPQIEVLGVSTVSGKELILDNSSTYNSYLYYLATNLEQVGVDESGKPCIVLGEDDYFILGDNWESSYDCMDKDCGPISSANLGHIVVAIINYDANYRMEMFRYSFKLLFKRK